MHFDELNKSTNFLLINDFKLGKVREKDPKRLSEVISTIKNVENRWTNPWYTPPLGKYGVIFYDKNMKKINEFRVTQKRVELRGCGDEQYSRITDAERTKIFQALGLDDPYNHDRRTNGMLDWFIDIVENSGSRKL